MTNLIKVLQLLSRYIGYLLVRTQYESRVENYDCTWSSLVVGDEGWIGPSRKLLCLC